VLLRPPDNDAERRASEQLAEREREMLARVRDLARAPGRSRVARVLDDVLAERAELSDEIRLKLARALGVDLGSEPARASEHSPERRVEARKTTYEHHRSEALARLAVSDAIAAREMFAVCGRHNALAAANELLHALPPHVAGPALGVSSDQRWDAAPAARSPLVEVCERAGGAIYRRATDDAGDRDHPAVLAALAKRGTGAPLSDAVRAAMEKQLGARFDRVRIHTDATAAAAATALGALAFTIGEDIFFGHGTPVSGHSELLAHELTHVVQAQQGRTASHGMSTRGDALEREAESVAHRVVSNAPSEHALAGERAAQSAMILRDSKTDVDSLVSSWITAKPFTINKSGPITSHAANKMVRITAPTITANSDVEMTLPPDKQLGSMSIKVGPIQTMLSSTRTGVYKKGSETKTINHAMGQVRDAAERAYADDPDVTPSPVAEPPFYSGNTASGGQPAASHLTVWEHEQAKYTATVSLVDQPGFTLPQQLPTGEQLSEIQGSDQFNTSAGFKTSTGQIVALAPFGWSLSWNTPIATDGSAQADPKHDAITTQTAQTAVVEDTPEYANQLARQEFDTLEQAMAQPGWALLKILPAVRARNPKSGGFIEEALRQKNPSFKVMIFPDRGVGQKALEPHGVGDDVTVQVSGNISKPGSSHEVTARQGTGGSVTIPLNEMIKSPADITASSTLSINVHEAKHMGGNAEIPFPFLGSGVVGQNEASEGDYRVEVSQL
jgi:hypothetical protein